MDGGEGRGAAEEEAEPPSGSSDAGGGGELSAGAIASPPPQDGFCPCVSTIPRCSALKIERTGGRHGVVAPPGDPAGECMNTPLFVTSVWCLPPLLSVVVERLGEHSARCTWPLAEITKTRARTIWSKHCQVGGYECRLLAYPKGDSQALPGYISIYLQVGRCPSCKYVPGRNV